MAASQFADEPSYQCQNCGNVGKIDASALGNGVFVCANCGLTSAEAGTKMQDELASLFKQNMQLSHVETAPQIMLPPAQQPSYSISQHYHHSAHVASPSSEAGFDQDIMEGRAALAREGVDVSAISPPQLQLYLRTDPRQRARLVEIWRQGLPGQSAGENGTDTAMDVEPQLRPRPQRAEAGAEPYMRSGYEILAERDYNRQSAPPSLKGQFNPLGSAVGNRGPPNYQQHADPAFSGREWWRNFAGDQPPEQPFGSPRRETSAEGDLEMS